MEVIFMSEINEKIKKLLRLSKSDNEYESKLALARARKLMAEYRLDIKDFDDTNKKVIEKVTDMYFTGYKNTYRLHLANAIAERYCCANYISSKKGSTRRYIALMGYEEDIMVVENLLKYADSCIDNWFSIKKKDDYLGCSNEYLNGLKNDYGMGFAEGLSVLLDEQMKCEENQEWGLVMVVPEEATKYVESLRTSGIKVNSSGSNNARIKGYTDGYNTKLNNQLNQSY